MALFGDFLNSSANQFGFKKDKGTRDAIFAVSETVNYYNSNGSTVISIFLKLSIRLAIQLCF